MITLFLALALTSPATEIPTVDRVEINHVVCNGDFKQIILWRWSWQRKRYIVAQWQMLPHGWHRETGGVIRWRDCDGRIYRVRAKCLIETIGIDSEVADRKRVEPANRLPYFDGSCADD
jgi:hypothetical protein